MAVQEYRAAGRASRSRRLAITSDDMIWFVNSALGRLGRLNPKTGEVKEWPSPSGPAVASLCDRGDRRHHLVQRIEQRPDALVRFDPKTEKFQSWAVPVRRRHHPSHAQDAGRQPDDSPDQHEPHRPGDHRQARGRRAAARRAFDRKVIAMRSALRRLLFSCCSVCWRRRRSRRAATSARFSSGTVAAGSIGPTKSPGTGLGQWRVVRGFAFRLGSRIGAKWGVEARVRAPR